jgi:chaperonin GroES
MKVVPVGEHVVVKRYQPEQPSPGELLLPASDYRPQEGRVLSVGDGRMLAGGGRLHPRVGEGDRVLYRTSGCTELNVGGETFVILNEDEILAVLG